MVGETSLIETIISGCTDEDATNYNPDANIDDGSCNNYLNTTDNAIWEDPDTLFWHDHNKSYIFANEDDAENFSWNREDYDEGIPAPYDGETDSDLLDLVTNFFWNYERDTFG